MARIVLRDNSVKNPGEHISPKTPLSEGVYAGQATNVALVRALL